MRSPSETLKSHYKKSLRQANEILLKEMFTSADQVDTQSGNELETLMNEQPGDKKMASKKTAAKKAPAKKSAAKKEPVKTAPAKKAPAKKAVAKKAPAKKAPAKKTAAKKVQYTAEQVYSMIEQAAYFAAENDGFSKDSATYWAHAEASIKAMIKG
jgi:hypothetical protein